MRLNVEYQMGKKAFLKLKETTTSINTNQKRKKEKRIVSLGTMAVRRRDAQKSYKIHCYITVILTLYCKIKKIK